MRNSASQAALRQLRASIEDAQRDLDLARRYVRVGLWMNALGLGGLAGAVLVALLLMKGVCA